MKRKFRFCYLGQDGRYYWEATTCLPGTSAVELISVHRDWYWNGRFYLQFTYLTGPERGRHDYVGPFVTTGQALNHRKNYGPTQADIVPKTSPPSPLLSPAAHMNEVLKRL